MNILGLEFEEGAEFYAEDGKLRFESRDNCKSKHVVYVHTVDEEIVYVGETSNTFYQRMYYYCNHKGRTNVRVREYMMDMIGEGREVKTYMYKPEEVLYESVMINPYVAIEQALIDRIKPILNRKNVHKREEREGKELKK